MCPGGESLTLAGCRTSDSNVLLRVHISLIFRLSIFSDEWDKSVLLYRQSFPLSVCGLRRFYGAFTDCIGLCTCHKRMVLRSLIAKRFSKGRSKLWQMKFYINTDFYSSQHWSVTFTTVYFWNCLNRSFITLYIIIHHMYYIRSTNVVSHSELYVVMLQIFRKKAVYTSLVARRSVNVPRSWIALLFKYKNDAKLCLSIDFPFVQYSTKSMCVHMATYT